MAEKSGLIQRQTTQNASACKTMTLRDQVLSMSGEIAKALPSVITPERFTRITLSAISRNPQLAQTNPASFMGAMMTAAQLGLEPNTPLGHAYIIPFRNKGILIAEFQIGYKGLIDLAYRSGEIAMIQAHIVYENDVFEYEYGLDPRLKHIPALNERGEPIGVYATFKTKSGSGNFEFMGIEAVRNHAKRFSKAYSSGNSPWTTNFEEMAKKTVLKKLLKYAPLKSDFIRQIESDGVARSYVPGVNILEEPSEIIMSDPPVLNCDPEIGAYDEAKEDTNQNE